MGDSFVKTTTEGWFSRVGKSFAGLIIGPIFVIVAVILLTWNEGHSAKTAAALNEGQKEVVSVSVDSINPANDKRLVYLTGPAATEEVLSDDLFGVEQNALILQRKSQIYVWKETKKTSSEKNLGGSETTTTKYSYDKVWSDRLINSNDFEREEGHVNPATLRFPSQSFVAKEAHLGAFHLGKDLVEKIGDEKQLVITEDTAKKEEDAAADEMKPHDGGYYIGADPQHPQIGDISIKFFYVAPTTISVVAGQVGSSLEVFSARNGTAIALVQSGTHGAEALFQTAKNENSVFTWLLRLAGFVLAVTGFGLVMKPLSVLADVLPILGTLVGAGTGLVALVLGLAVSMVTIAIAWIAYRPVVAVLLLLASAAVVTLFFRRKRVAIATGS